MTSARLVIAGLVVLLGAGCPSAGTSTNAPLTPVYPQDPGAAPTPGSTPNSPASSTPVARDDPASAGRTDQLSAAEREQRAKGIAAMDAGRFDEAKRIFEALLDRHPGNAAVASLYEGASIALGQMQQEASLELANLTPTALARPPFKYTKRRDAPVAQGPKPPRLAKVSESRNEITDTERWFTDNALRMPVWEVPNPMRQRDGNLPPQVPLTFGRAKIVDAIQDDGHAILFYAPDYSGGRYVLVLDGSGDVKGAYDFGPWARSPKDRPADASFTEQRVNWAVVRDGVLFVSTGHNTYAKSSGGLTGYISALDLATGQLLWRSAPIVANARNFVYRDGYIITGYGFTAEPDFMFVLDAKTGKTLSKVKVKSGPSVILEKNGQIFVRTYDTDYVFDLK